MNSISEHKKALRMMMREKRRSLSDADRSRAAKRLLINARRSSAIRDAGRIALYLSFDGELDPAQLAADLWRRGKRVYLPILSRLTPGQLRFVRYTPSSKLRKNRFGIPEPTLKQSVPGSRLDLVLLPLTAFDDHGGRLGMGGGFYDRTFPAQRAHLSFKPQLIGVAYQFQRVARLPVEGHDRRIHAVLTD